MRKKISNFHKLLNGIKISNIRIFIYKNFDKKKADINASLF